MPEPEKPTPPPEPRLARLGTAPDWSALDAYQRTITQTEFKRLLEHCYAQKPDAWRDFIELQPDRARIVRQSNFPEAGHYDLYFLSDRRKPVEIPRYWRPPWALAKLPPNDNQPLAGVHIAIDPGHIGGRWADIEQRYYKIGADTIPVVEGDMTLITAKILETNLHAMGARVTLTRRDNEPVTPIREDDLVDEAKNWLKLSAGDFAPKALVERTASRLFYVSSELRARAAIINTATRPDLVLCLHFNAAPWLNPYRPAFRSQNHLHLLINGCYNKDEIAEDDTRLELLLRLLQRTYYYELAVAEEISKTMADETRLPPFGYDGLAGKSVNGNPYIWARNLLVNRTFMCPVVFFEPYCMNHREVHARVQAGPYRRLRMINGVSRKNIYQEYADGITAGLVNYYRKVRQ